MLAYACLRPLGLYALDEMKAELDNRLENIAAQANQ